MSVELPELMPEPEPDDSGATSSTQSLVMAKGFQNVVDSQDATRRSIDTLNDNFSKFLDMQSRFGDSVDGRAEAGEMAGQSIGNPLAGYDLDENGMPSSVQDAQAQAMMSGLDNLPSSNGMAGYDMQGHGGYGLGGAGHGFPGYGMPFGGIFGGGGFYGQSQTGGVGPSGLPSGSPMGPYEAPTGSRFVGGGLTGALNSFVTNTVPGFSVVNDIGNEVLSQVNKDNAFRYVTGGDHQDALRERLSQFAGRESSALSRYGQVSGEDYDKMYQQTVALGLTDTRDKANAGTALPSQEQGMQFQTNLLTRTGMGTQEAGQYLQVALKQSMTSLSDFENRIVAVGDAAQKAGVNAETARQNFVKMVQNSDGSFGAGISQVASTLTGYQTAGGAAFTANTDFSQYASQNMEYRAASQNKMSIQSFQHLQITDPAAALKMISGVQNQIVSNITSGPGWTEAINHAVEAGGGKDALAAGKLDWTSANTDLLANLPADVNVVKQSLQALGAPAFDNDQAMAQYIIQERAGAGVGNAIDKDAAANSTQANGKIVGTDKAAPKLQDQDKATDVNKKGEANGHSWWNQGLIGEWAGYNKNNEIKDAYHDWQKTNVGGRNEVMENIVSNVNNKNFGEDKVIVNAGGGKRVVSMQEAVTKYFDQVTTNTATFANGDHKGEAVSAAFGGGKVSTDETSKAKAKAEAEDPKNAKLGQTLEAYLKDHNADGTPKKGATTAPQNVNVTIGLDDGAKGLLKVTSKTGTSNDASGLTSSSPFGTNANPGI